ncbi:Shedu anti-phage system protein SduA domain-containing protein [Citrobacter freundii]|uniref:Shedu anti-phage system protein SduA domain-containing protein n=1 Tax=Citrobacter freundii TaxID=546 RepID=UPI0029383BF6|nr:Shedu anti-phage system protein SduA domain-containing protein [Citrobacter freundii]ELQ7797670.1 DUF4263 domain-containing protein [Citrobacter freundii]MEA8856155.1 DUF4263 domain-containing protein [Citrobacter freundii]
MTDIVHTTIKPLVDVFLQELAVRYWTPLYHYVKENPQLIKRMPGFLLLHQEIIVYVGQTHIAIEYNDSEVIDELPDGYNMEVQYFDYSVNECNLFEKIVGFEYDSTVDFNFDLPTLSEDLLFPTNRGYDKLRELGWNFSAQNSIMGFNVPTPTVTKGKFSRVVNGMFFDADESGLKTRRIKWIDFFPIFFDGSDEHKDTIGISLDGIEDLIKHDAHYCYPLPDDYKYKQLPKINKFIEKWGDVKSSEPEITSFLSEVENEFILTMKFGATAIHSEVTCEWQSEQRPSIRPDFFVVQPNGYADIVEFKLPTIDKSFVVGSKNRETFSAWLNSYISQTRVYSTYFDDPNNRRWFEDKYGFKVLKPRRWLVIGRRHDFDSDVWREIMLDYRDLEILTFDDLIDGVVTQFYR